MPWWNSKLSSWSSCGTILQANQFLERCTSLHLETLMIPCLFDHINNNQQRCRGWVCWVCSSGKWSDWRWMHEMLNGLKLVNVASALIVWLCAYRLIIYFVLCLIFFVYHIPFLHLVVLLYAFNDHLFVFFLHMYSLFLVALIYESVYLVIVNCLLLLTR